jgi:hypothetical protein
MKPQREAKTVESAELLLKAVYKKEQTDGPWQTNLALFYGL